MHKSAEVTAEEKFANHINHCLAQKRWTPTMLYVQANALSDTGTEIFSPRSLQKWISAQGLPKIESVVAMAEALRMPDLINVRVELEVARFKR